MNVQLQRRASQVAAIGFELAEQSNFLLIDLDAILHNVHIIHSKCSPHTEIISVIKANAYGHGSLMLSRYLYDNGLRHFAVATPLEGKELRQAGVQGFVQIFGSCVAEEVDVMWKYQLTPTVSAVAFLEQWSSMTQHCDQHQVKSPAVVIKVDTGMSRNGCQPEELKDLMQFCVEHGVPVHSIMTHFAQAWDDDGFTKQQLEIFLAAVKPYRNDGIKVHAANSAAILRGVATDLDFVRPGMSLYGFTPDSNEKTVRFIEKVGLKPALSWIAHPTLVKCLPAGHHVGYDQTYVLDKEETIATFALGYADGYNRKLSDKGIILTMDGEEQPVVGRVSMDAITVRVKQETTTGTLFYIYTNDFTSPNCISSVSRTLGTIPYEVGTSLAHRVPRLYTAENAIFTEDGKRASLAGLSQCC